MTLTSEEHSPSDKLSNAVLRDGRLRRLSSSTIWIKICPLVIGAIIWQLLSLRLPSYVLPSIPSVASAFWHSLITGVIVKHFLISLARVAVGFAIGSVFGVGLGFAMAYSRVTRYLTDYIIRGVQPIPGIAWIGLTLVWFGLGETAIVSVIVITIVPVVVLTTYEGFRGVEPEFLQAARTLGVNSQWGLFRSVSFPAALPYVLNGLHMGLAYGWRVLAAAEIIGATSGLGYWLNFNRVALNTSDVFVVLVIFAVTMIVIEELFKIFERRMIGGWSS